jgi:RNA polymerase sigma-70 factor, ECF subfamily
MPDDRLTSLYRRYGPVIYDRCRSMLDDPAEAEDATHETFLRLHRHLDRVPQTRQALFWIYRVATNYCLNEIRNRRRRPAATEDLPELPRELRGDGEQPIIDRDLVRRVIEGAPAKVRSVVWLYHVDGLEQDEVARVLDISRRTVAARLAAFSGRVRRFRTRSGP